MALTYTLKISEKKLQAKLSAMMPVEKKKYLLSVVLSNPVVDLTNEKNVIGIFSHIDVLAPGNLSASGKAKICGTLRYDPDQGAFYFCNPEFLYLEISKVPEKFIPAIKKIVLLVANQVLSRRPVYSLKPDQLKHQLARLLLKSVTVKNGKLQLELSAGKN